MKIYLAEVLINEGQKKSFLFSEYAKKDQIEFSGELIEIIQPINVSGHVVNYEGKIHAQLKIETSVRRICSRCLCSYEEEIDISADYVFTKEIFNSEEGYDLFTGDSLIIDDIVLDEITSQISMKPLCKKNCKGLCPVCGKNKNLTSCNCKIEKNDPRLEILKSFLEEK